MDEEVANLDLKEEELGGLYEIRLPLSIERITSSTIKQSKFRSIVDDATKDKDKQVEEAIDSVLEIFLGKVKDAKPNINKTKYTVEDIDKIISSNIKFMQEEEIKDKQLIKENNFLNSSDKAA